MPESGRPSASKERGPGVHERRHIPSFGQRVLLGLSTECSRSLLRREALISTSLRCSIVRWLLLGRRCRLALERRGGGGGGGGAVCAELRSRSRCGLLSCDERPLVLPLPLERSSHVIFYLFANWGRR